MQKTVETLFETQFEEDIYQGLTDFPKHLSSKYFYDIKGDKLFQDIMNMPEYYLTDCEFEIFEKHKKEITNQFSSVSGKFSLIELGAGDGKKTKILLKQLINNNAAFKYQPIDISQNVLNQLESSLENEMPDLGSRNSTRNLF